MKKISYLLLIFLKAFLKNDEGICAKITASSIKMQPKVSRGESHVLSNAADAITLNTDSRLIRIDAEVGSVYF